MATLYYWPIRGRGEVMRLLCAEAEVPLTVEVPQDFKTDKEAYPFGQCPRYKDDKVDMCQSNAILRYLARRHGLEGGSDSERVLVDQACEVVESLRSKYVPLIYQEQLSAEGKAAFKATHISADNINGRNGGAHVAFLDWFVKRGKDNHITGSGLTLGDLAIWEILDILLRIFPEIATEYPALGAFHEGLPKAHPRIAAYLSSPARPAAVNGNSLG